MFSFLIEAQDNKPFYERDFAKAGGLKSKPAPSPTAGALAPVELTRGQNNESFLTDREPSLTKEKVISIAVVLSGLNPAHVQQVIDATTPLLKRGVPLKNAIIIGKSIDAKRLSQFFQKFGVTSNIVESLPAALPVQRSPTWVIHLKDEDVLLDGFLKIEPYLTDENFFVPPERR